MASKDLIGLVLAFMGIAGGVIVACISTRARDLFFLAMIWLAPMTEDYDINFVSRDFFLPIFIARHDSWFRVFTRGHPLDQLAPERAADSEAGKLSRLLAGQPGTDDPVFPLRLFQRGDR
jgi:hypothetical protein